MIASRDVHTHSVNADGWVSTFVDICAVASTPVKFITDVTFTSEKSWNIPAMSVDTDTSEGTFINVLTGLSISSRNKTHVAFTAKAARHVQTVATLTQISVLCTLVTV